ncbi:TetR/AcrR family transcriptional regulator [Actinomadura sp. WAC 06369]|uniref:TetR/AcrR family transcriptional regulator n=1 Tax=Actinomadura sp. WAC 06369 TaxID=2203193 RepID=UPI000F770336|nr:TetR/AcrR family transcriptional regulator [Actinomadura sp. WAC 06369]RSN54143.1 TetR family transcriptional regulator [Actinomadura sp. WAC 06369]
MSPKNEPSGRKRRSFIEEARRAQIVEAAALVVAEAGYANASLSRIAERAGISKSVITYHFSGKDDLLRTVVTGFFDRVWTHMEARISAEPTALGQVRAWIGAQLEYFAAHRTEFLAMIEIVAGHRTADGAPAFAAETAEEVDGLAEILARGQRDGEFRAFEPRTVANIILRCADGVLGSWADDGAVDLPAQSAALLDFIDHAVRSGP